MLNWLNKISLQKAVIYFFIFILLIITIYKLTPYNTKRTISVGIYDQLPLKYQAIAKIILRDNYDIRNLKNDYNINFLPWTQFVELDFKENFFGINLKKSDNYFGKKNVLHPFFLEIINDDVWIIDSEGNVSKINFNDIASNITEKIKASNIQSNLKKKKKNY